MQRSLAGVLFLLAAVAFGLAVGGWWLQRTVLTPADTRGQTEAILDNAEIRLEISTVVAAATSSTLAQTPNEIASFVDPIIASRPGAAVMADIVEQAHRRLLGDDEPVRVSGAQMVEIVRDERVAELSPVTLPVPEVGTLKLLDTVTTWMPPIMAVIGVILTLLAFVTRPERGEVVRALGELGVSLGASLLVFGYLLPVFLVPAIDDNTWTQAAPRLALRSAPLVVVATVILAVGGVVLIVASASTGKRKQWSTPLSVARYRDDRSWS